MRAIIVHAAAAGRMVTAAKSYAAAAARTGLAPVAVQCYPGASKVRMHEYAANYQSGQAVGIYIACMAIGAPRLGQSHAATLAQLQCNVLSSS